MDVRTLSERILDSNFGLEIVHSEDVGDSPPSEGNDLTHYGILGMKWGVRRTPEQLGHVKKKDRRYEGETDQQYQLRMDRESRERTAKTTAKAQETQLKAKLKAEADTQKRALKSQEKREKALLKSQEKERKAQLKDAAAQRKEQAAERAKQSDKKSATKTIIGDSARGMTDQELNDAITRLRKEAEYKMLTKKPDGLLKKSLKGAAGVGGGVALAVGKNILTRQLSDIGNQKAEKYLVSKGYKEPSKGTNIKESDFKKAQSDIETLLKAMGLA